MSAIRVKKFDPSTIKESRILFIIGKRHTGKSVLMKDLLYQKQKVPHTHTRTPRATRSPPSWRHDPCRTTSSGIPATALLPTVGTWFTLIAYHSSHILTEERRMRSFPSSSARASVREMARTLVIISPSSLLPRV